MLSIAHIALTVSDLDKSLGFYEELLNFKELERHYIEKDKLIIALIEHENIQLELFHFENCEPLPDYRKDLASDLKTIGTKHIAFHVSDIASKYNKFKEIGINFVTDLEVFPNGSKYFFITDPDGNFLEFMSVD